MAIFAQMSLVPPIAAPLQLVECILDVNNTGTNAITINGIRGQMMDAGTKEATSGYGPQFALVPGVSAAVPGPGTLRYRASLIATAPPGWRFINPNLPQPPADPPQFDKPAMQAVEPTLPQQFVYNIGAVIAFADGTELRVTGTPLTVFPEPVSQVNINAGLGINGMLDFHLIAQSGLIPLTFTV